MKRIVLLVILIPVFYIKPASAQVDSLEAQLAVRDTQNVNIRLFQSDSLFDIALRFDITTYKRKKSDTTYLDGILTYRTGERDSVNKPVRIKARGDIRRKICDFPPMFLNFKMKDTEKGEFIGIDKLKLVPYCNIGYEDYVLREFLVYKLYSVFTDLSFKVRLLRITFINTARKGKPFVQYGFAIEPLKLLEKRTNTREIQAKALSPKYVTPENLDRVAIFNYMIGNTDWYVNNLHNIVAVYQPGPGQSGLLVPYDFDYSGLINASYAVPFESLPIKSVRDRYFMGLCRSESTYLNALKEFSAKKDELYGVVNNFPYLSARSKKDMIIYLDKFFGMFDKRNSIVQDLLRDCMKL